MNVSLLQVACNLSSLSPPRVTLESAGELLGPGSEAEPSWLHFSALYTIPPYHPIIIIEWFIGSFFFFESSSYTLASVLFLVGPWLSTCQDWKKIWKKERSYWFFNRCCLLWSIFMSTTSFTGTSLIQFWIHVLFLCTCCTPVSFFYEHVTSEGDYRWNFKISCKISTLVTVAAFYFSNVILLKACWRPEIVGRLAELCF